MADPIEVTAVEKKASPKNVRDSNLKPRPETQLDVQASLIEPNIGRQGIAHGLNEMYKLKYNEDFTKEEQTIDGWDIFSQITSDVRLSNLDKEELEYVRWAMRMQGYCTLLRLPKSMATSTWLMTTIVEPSLGKNMALRNILQTIKQESQHLQIQEEPKKKSILGGMFGRKDNNQG